MATFVEITPDAFNEGFSNAASSALFDRLGGVEGGVNGQTHVRRPVRGIQLKEESYATIQVRTADGRNLALFDAAGQIPGPGGQLTDGFTTHNSNFLIQSLQEQRVEKSQIVMTFGEPYIFFFGEQPRILQVSGVLLNTQDFNWRAEWWENYDRYLRGTRCVQARTRVYLSWDDIIVEGYIMQAGASESPTEQNYVQFQFQMFLTNYQNISGIGDPMGHMTGRDVELDPFEVNAFRQSLRDLESSTLRVRNMNIQYAQLSEGSGIGSLLGVLRGALSGGITSGGFSASASVSLGTNRLVATAAGQIGDILAEAGRFVSGRNIRVPIGFEGSAVFEDAQIALASIEGSAGIIGVLESLDRQVELAVTVGGVTKFIRGTVGQQSTPARFGPLSLNEDEFIARRYPPSNGRKVATDLFANQLAQDIELGDRVRDTFAAYGVDVEPPDEIRLMLIRGVFGIASIGLGAGLNALKGSSGTARFAANLL